MANYKNIKGFQVQSLDSDPVVSGGSWSSGGNLNNPRGQIRMGTTGISTNAVAVGGFDVTAPAVRAYTETYNGTAWTETGDVPSTVRLGESGGSTTSLLYAGGSTGPGGAPINPTGFEFDGSSWTAGGAMNNARRQGAGAGTALTVAIVFGGGDNPGPNQDYTETYNGTAFTEVGDLNTARKNQAGCGTNTAALCMSGDDSTSVESWNGTSWTEMSANMVTGGAGFGGAGTTTAALTFGSNPAGNAMPTQSFDGTSWTEVADMGTQRSGSGSGSGTSTDAIMAGGYGPPTAQKQATEEWTVPPITANILGEGQMWFNSTTSLLKGYTKYGGVPTGTWSSGGAMNTGRSAHFSLGGLTDNIVTAPQGVVTTEQYDGSSWTALPSTSNLGEGRAEGGSFGTSTAGLVFGGIEPGTTAITESWDGSSWTETTNLNTARNEQAGLGRQSAGLSVGGAPSTAIVESWNGSTWTEISDLNTGRGNLGAAGTTTDGLAFGGWTPAKSEAESFDGTSWTEVGDLNTARGYGAASGASSYGCLYAGGYTGSPSTATEVWNGSAWTEVGDMSSGQYSGKGAPTGSSVAAIMTGGSDSPNTATEQFEAPATISTVTTS
tara:strand:+ start:447 stop:2267 length:1821 start_codon:yes stop_codon:yes gene_type:complete